MCVIFNNLDSLSNRIPITEWKSYCFPRRGIYKTEVVLNVYIDCRFPVKLHLFFTYQVINFRVPCEYTVFA